MVSASDFPSSNSKQGLVLLVKPQVSATLDIPSTYGDRNTMKRVQSTHHAASHSKSPQRFHSMSRPAIHPSKRIHATQQSPSRAKMSVTCPTRRIVGHSKLPIRLHAPSRPATHSPQHGTGRVRRPRRGNIPVQRPSLNIHAAVGSERMRKSPPSSRPAHLGGIRHPPRSGKSGAHHHQHRKIAI